MCSDEIEGNILSEIVEIDDMSSVEELEAGPLSVTDNLCDSDEEFDYCCRKASTGNAPVAAKPLGQPSVGISDTTSTAAVCSDPPLFANSSEHEHGEGQTSMSTCGDAGQALITPVVAPIVSMCANPDVCMDAEKPTDSVSCDSASLCLDSSLFEGDEEPWSNIFGSELPCADNMWVDAEKPTDTSNSMLLLADSNVSLVTGNSTSNICYNTPVRAGSNVCVDKEVNVYMTPENSVVICNDANLLTAEKEEVGGDIAFCGEQELTRVCSWMTEASCRELPVIAPVLQIEGRCTRWKAR
ncbi:hypothetical protein HPB51_020124 [Rhipicephalus microplus]|uniref:Uncharacterized protein n=1 Tax=Rhipicephalus microplus TaxID=6941 RepID=A0A9J6EI63_RHIMP|nr:hypothetical protein HPB51_020124 [Rhipicephalus microplus]